VADLCVHLLESTTAVDTTFEVRSTVPFSEPWTEQAALLAAPRDWEATLLAAGLKRGVTGKTIDGVYTGRQVEAEALRKPEPEAARM
jgi:hypothetical protein